MKTAEFSGVFVFLKIHIVSFSVIEVRRNVWSFDYYRSFYNF